MAGGDPRSRPSVGRLVPAFAPGYRVHVVSEQEALVIGSACHVTLRGRAHALVAPLIDGCAGDEEIVAKLAQELPASMVQLALMRLADQGLIVYVAPGAASVPPAARASSGTPFAGFEPPSPGELAWVGIGVDDGVISRLRSLVDTRDRDARRGLTVAAVDDYLRPELDRLAARCREHGSALLPIGVGAAEWWIGPCFDGPESEPTWDLFRRRLRDNRRADVEALERGATFPLRAVVGDLDDALAGDQRFAHAAEAIERAARCDPQPELVGGVVVVEARGSEPTVHRVSAASPTGPMLERVAPLISPITGVIAGLERVPALAGTHVYATAGTLEWPDDRERQRPRPVFRHGALGKGLTDAQARIACIGEALELASARFTGAEPRRRARWAELAELAIHPAELLLISDRQYAEAAARRPPQSWDGIPPRFDEGRAIEWVSSVSLVTGEARWLPAAYCYFDYEDPAFPGPLFATATANGCAVGATREEAILQGLLELIERDACALWWYSRAPRPGIALDSLGDPRLAAIRDAHAALGRELVLLDLRSDTRVAVVAAVAWERGPGTLLPIGRGCHLDPTRAIEHALAELSQVTAVASPDEDPPATIDARPYVRPDASPPLAAQQLPDLRGADAQAGIDWCVRMLDGLGLEVLVLDTTRPEIGVPAVRVVVPGLRPLLRRLGPGRLYEVPPALGWVSRPLAETELNPDGFAS